MYLWAEKNWLNVGIYPLPDADLGSSENFLFKSVYDIDIDI